MADSLQDQLKARKAEITKELNTGDPEGVQPEASAFSISEQVSNKAMDLGATTAAVIRGGVRSMFDVTGTGLEAAETLVFYPIQAGAELAARMFIPDDDQPDLTTMQEFFLDRIKVTENLNKMAPGVERGTELAIGLASLGALAKQGVKSSIKGVNVAKQRLQVIRSNQQMKKAKKLADVLLGEGEGQVLDAMIKRPKRVAEVLSKNRDISVDDVALSMQEELADASKMIGKRVGKFKEAALADNQTLRQISPDAMDVIKSIRADTTTSTGVDLLPKEIQTSMNTVEDLIKSGFITPADAVKASGELDGILAFGFKSEQGAPAVKLANAKLKGLKRMIKQSVRDSVEGWAEADDLFSRFKELRQGVPGSGDRDIMKALTGDSRISFVNTMFNDAKSATRQRLEGLLELRDQVMKGAGSPQEFFNRVADIKAAQGIKKAKFELTRPLQNKANKILAKWTALGAATGSGVGSLAGKAAGVSPMLSVPTGAALGGSVGAAVGAKMGDPTRILRIAQRAKGLNSQARELARDMDFIHGILGNAGVVSFLESAKDVAAVKALGEFARTVESNEPKKKEAPKRLQVNPKEVRVNLMRQFGAE